MKSMLQIAVASVAMAQTSTVVIVPESLVPAANAVAAQHFDAVGGSNTFRAEVVTLGTTNVYGRWCAARFSATNRVLLNTLAAAPPFAGQLIIGDYDADTDPTFPHRLLSTNGLAVYAPPLN